MVERVIVTGADSRYFPLVDDLCASVRSFRTSNEIGLAVVDAGLLDQQTQHLITQYRAQILQFDWGFPLAERRAKGRHHLKTQIARSFLDRLLPDARLIAWIDGDAWVQDIAAVDMMFNAAEQGRLVIISDTSRYTSFTHSFRWGVFGIAQVRSTLYKNARHARVVEKEARLIAEKGLLNSGVFVLHRNSPYWEAWRLRQSQIIRHGRIFTSDQLSLALAVYCDGVPVELAPDFCNYMGPWVCSNDERCLVEAYVPNARVGIVHMAGQNAIRHDPQAMLEIRRLDGVKITKSLRRSAWVDTLS